MNTTSNNYSQDIAEALSNVTGSLASLIAGVNHLKSLLDSSTVEPDIGTPDPLDPANKNEQGKLTARGVEICYRLFDAGNSRYAVGHLMDISFTAANHRHQTWQNLGGSQRTKQPLD